jgi:EAL domain-containing protein (putative c-di-GMP-specific phosphodiesterase class I)
LFLGFNAFPRAKDNTAITHAIVGIAHSLGLTVVAEGVETEAELSTLYALDCEYGQGFLLARPMSVDDLTVLLAAEAIPA